MNNERVGAFHFSRVLLGLVSLIGVPAASADPSVEKSVAAPSKKISLIDAVARANKEVAGLEDFDSSPIDAHKCLAGEFRLKAVNLQRESQEDGSTLVTTSIQVPVGAKLSFRTKAHEQAIANAKKAIGEAKQAAVADVELFKSCWGARRLNGTGRRPVYGVEYIWIHKTIQCPRRNRMSEADYFSKLHEHEEQGRGAIRQAEATWKQTKEDVNNRVRAARAEAERVHVQIRIPADQVNQVNLEKLVSSKIPVVLDVAVEDYEGVRENLESGGFARVSRVTLKATQFPPAFMKVRTTKK